MYLIGWEGRRIVFLGQGCGLLKERVCEWEVEDVPKESTRRRMGKGKISLFRKCSGAESGSGLAGVWQCQHRREGGSGLFSLGTPFTSYAPGIFMAVMVTFPPV